MTTDDGLVYRGHRLVIPEKESPNIVKGLHESHIGIEETLRRARKCGSCNSYRPEQCKEPLEPYDVPDVPWEMVWVDLFVLERQ